MKILLDKYPKGTYKGQMSDGKYINEYLYENLTILAKAIVEDNTFLAVIYSSTLEVGTGKSVFGTQIGEAWSDIMKKTHNIDVPFTMNNVVFRPKDLIERAFKVPRYSCILLDEWEDATYWSELGMTLRQFFRKCRQLNLFMIVIIPNWFQMPMSYAISRSIFAIDVRFENGFERGYFYFYDFEKKRELYVKGKREHNYRAAHHVFAGRFINGYGVNEEEYRRIKLEDTMSYEEGGKKEPKEIEVKSKIAIAFHKKFPEISVLELGEVFGWKKSMTYLVLKGKFIKENNTPQVQIQPSNTYINESIEEDEDEKNNIDNSDAKTKIN